MGQKRIKIVDLSASKKEAKKKPEKGRRVVKTGKERGRLTDMGQVMLEETEKRAAEEKKPSLPSLPSLPSKPSRVRSHRFAALRKMVKRDKFYPPEKAIEVLKEITNASFDETVELHLVSLNTGVLGKAQLPHSVNKESSLEIKTEKKFPLAHLKIGKASWPKKKLLENLKAVLETLNLPRIRKAVLTSTMTPGIKLALKKEKIVSSLHTSKV